MRRLFPAVVALALAAAACGGGDGAGTTAAPASTTSTAAQPTTTAPTTTEATTTTSPADFRVGLARIFSGEWVGEWSNTTFETTGPVSLALAVDVGARTLTVYIDLGGGVFGGDDPDPFDLVADLTAAPPYTTATPLLGEVTLQVEASGAFTLEAAEVPAAGIASFSAAGNATSMGINARYTVAFEDGSAAEGTVVLQRPTQ